MKLVELSTGDIAYRYEKSIVLFFAGKRKVLSTSLYNGGYREELVAVFNHDGTIGAGIGFKMLTEQTLFYSINCFGTADAISFRDNILRIHDLKTGQTVASMKQLEIYAALFCLEYNKNPTDIDIELRLYQLDEVLIHHPEPEEILYIMEKIKDFDKRIERLKDKE